MITKPSFTSGSFAFSVDGEAPAAYIKEMSGGNIKSEVQTYDLSTALEQKKTVSGISFEDISVKLSLGTPTAKGFYGWIQAAFDYGAIKKNGEMHACGFDRKSVFLREFYDAYITEVGFPALDGSSKEPCSMDVKITPTEIRYNKGTGQEVIGDVAATQKKWLSSNFRVSVGGLPCDNVTKVDALQWKMNTAKEEIGTRRFAHLVPAKIEVPNVKLTINSKDLQPWMDWSKAFTVDGNTGDANELAGAIEFLSPNLQEVLGTIELRNLGCVSLDPGSFTANQEEVATFTVELYCEGMRFNGAAM